MHSSAPPPDSGLRRDPVLHPGRRLLRRSGPLRRLGLPRRSGPLRRLLGTAVATLLMVGGLVLGAAAPAVADPPELRFEDRCGAVAFSWDTGTIGGSESWSTTVLRNGAVVDRFEMRARGGAAYGAQDGDAFEVRREGLPAANYLHRAPDGCVGAPALTVTAANECFSLLLTFTNLGDTPVTGLQILVDGSPPRNVDLVGHGSLDLHLGLTDGDTFRVRGPLAGGGWATWLTGDYDRPERCTPDAVEVRFTDVCGGVRVDLASAAGGVIRVEVTAGDVFGGNAVLAPGGTGRIEVTAAPGARVLVRDAVAGAELGRHTIGSLDCGTATPSPGAPGGTAPPDGGPDDPGTGTGTGGGLPLTGPQAALFAGAGALLVGTGAALFLVARRRRLRFTAPDGGAR